MVSVDAGANWSPRYVPGGISSEIDAVGCESKGICIGVDAGPASSAAGSSYLVSSVSAQSFHWANGPRGLLWWRAVTCGFESSCVAVAEGQKGPIVVELGASGPRASAGLPRAPGLLVDAIWCSQASSACIVAGGSKSSGPLFMTSKLHGSTWTPWRRSEI